MHAWLRKAHTTHACMAHNLLWDQADKVELRTVADIPLDFYKKKKEEK